MPPEIAVDLLQARANIHQVPIAFIMRLLYVLWFLALLLPSIIQLFKTLVVALSI
jgi:flagellar biosynthesis protein FliQ